MSGKSMVMTHITLHCDGFNLHSWTHITYMMNLALDNKIQTGARKAWSWDPMEAA